MADIKINVKTEGGEEAINSITNIKKQIKELRSQALSIGEGSKGFKQLTQQANELQDKLDDLKDSSKSLQGTGIEKLKSSFGLLTESFKNADFGKAKTAFQGLGSAMKAIPIFLIIEGIQYLVENFEKLSQGSGFLAKALQFVGDIISKVTEGITWLLDKLGLVNAEMDKQSEKLTKNAEKGKKAIEEQNTAYDQQIVLLKSQGKSTVALEIAKQDAIIKTNQLLVQQTIDFVRSGGELSKAQKDVLTEQLKAIKQASVDKQVVINTDIKTTSDAHKKAADEQSKLDKERAEKRLKESQEQAEYTRKQMADVNKMIAADAAKEESDRLKASQKALEDSINTQSEAKRKAEEEDIKREGDALQRHYDMINSVNGVSSTLTGALKGINSELSNLVSGIVTSMTSAFNVISDNSASTVDKITAGLSAVGSLIGQISAYLMQEAQQQAQEVEDSYSRQSEALNTAKDEELAKEGLTAQQKIDIENKYKMQDYNLKLLAYNKETEIKKKAFEQDKKLKIAQTVIATITGVVSAVTGMIQAVPGPVGIVLGALAGIAVAAMGAIQVAQINKQKFDAGSPPQAPTLTPPSDVSSGAGGGNGGGAQAGPNLYAAGQGDVNTGQGGPNGQRQSQPQKVYVVSQEVTSSQNMNAVIERRSSF